MLEFESKCTIGIDLAALSKNPTGLALLKGKTVKTSLVYTDKEILEYIINNQPALIAIDAPLSLPAKGEAFRKADREMVKKGYHVFLPTFLAMKTLTLRAIKLNKLIEENKYRTIEVHPTSTRKALQMSLKERKTIQENLKNTGAERRIRKTPVGNT